MLEINKIHLGNCYELIKQIPDKSIDLIYTDIPYLYSNNKGTSKNLEIQNKSMNKGVFQEINDFSKGINYDIFDEFIRIMKHIYIYIWCSKEQIFEIMNYFIIKHNCLFDILTWHKLNVAPLINNNYLPDTEYCLLFRDKGTKMFGNYNTKNKFYISTTNKRDKNDYKHPTIKPYCFVKNHIINSSNENDLILDPFCGSGTTCAAAKECKRRYIGIEINPEYYKIATDRLNGIDAHGQMSLLDTDFDLLKKENL